MQHILAAVDLSSITPKVAQRARELADLFGSKLSLVHVLEYRPIVYSGSEFSMPLDNSVMEVFEKNAKAALKKLGVELHVPESQQYLEVDAIKQAIVNLAEKLKVDLLVVGSHGRHGAALLLGSTANAILHAAKCDVLAVRV